MRNVVTLFTRQGCHLCELAEETLRAMQEELDFDIEKRFIEGDPDLIAKYGEQIPVILIDGEHHDFWRVDPGRFRSSLDKRRRHQ
jgi:glutaredoxin